MCRNTLVLLVAALSAASTLFSTESIEQYASREALLSKFIVKSAEKNRRIFPKIWTGRRSKVRLNDDSMSKALRYRYKLTYEKYVPLHQFKERIGQESVKEMQDCIEKLDKR